MLAAQVSSLGKEAEETLRSVSVNVLCSLLSPDTCQLLLIHTATTSHLNPPVCVCSECCIINA